MFSAIAPYIVLFLLILFVFLAGYYFADIQCKKKTIKTLENKDLVQLTDDGNIFLKDLKSKDKFF